MQDYVIVTPESLVKMSECFTSTEEIVTFMTHLNEVVDELAFQTQLVKRTGEKANTAIIMSQICAISIFFREHMELIHQLIFNLETKPVTEEEMKGLSKEEG